MLNNRSNTKEIKIGSVAIGASNPIAVQSMTNTKTYDVDSTVEQIKQLQKAGCDIVRVSIPDDASVDALPEIKKRVDLPIVADIHFKPTLALKAIENGADKIRVNPGTIRDKARFKAIIEAAAIKNIPIRIGANSGSVPEKYQELKHSDLSKALVESVLDTISIFEDEGFNDLVISCKASDVIETIKAYEELSKNTDYPLHLGVTEAGTLQSGCIKSAVGLAPLLHKGIGDTIRISLTADPVEEVKAAFKILSALNIRKRGADIISCPSCARCDIDVISLANKVEQALAGRSKPIKVAVMGCEVNGPQEAKEADVGIAAGKENGLLFKNGKVLGKFREKELFDLLMREIESID